MARAEWGYNGRGKWCSYKRTTIVICTINIGVALYVLHSLYTSLYTYPYSDLQNDFRYTPDQIRKMEESIRIRKAAEPIELVKLAKKIKGEFLSEEKTVELPQYLKQKISDEILDKLRGLNANASSSDQREAVESWRKEKIKEAKKLTHEQALNSTILPQDSEMLARALESDWDQLSEEIGLWIPVEIIHKEHDDKPAGADEFDEEPLPGRKPPPECHAELRTDYDGAAVRWALPTIKKVLMTAVRLAWIRLDLPKWEKRNAMFGYIAHQRRDAILQISMNTKMGSAG